MIKKDSFLVSGMSFMSASELAEIEFSPNELGTPFGDNLAHQLGSICHQFGDNKIPALPPISLLPVTNSEVFEVMEKGGDLIHVEASHAIA